MIQKLFIIAGEASGDTLGAAILKEFCARNPHVQIQGIGVPQMAEAGRFSSLFPFQDLSIMGKEILWRLPSLWRRLRQTHEALVRFAPDILLTIDCPEFSFRVAKAARILPLRRVHCVAPSVWAWRPGRAQKIARFLDHLCVLFPFEPPYFETWGLPTTYVGHPFAEKELSSNTDILYQFYPHLADRPPHCALLPGSRRSEIKTLLPLFIQTLAHLDIAHPHVVIPTLPHLLPLLQDTLSQCAPSADVCITLVPEKDLHAPLLHLSRTALAASGTVTLELGLQAVPMVVAYQVGWMMEKIVQASLKTPYVALPNILLGREVVPECLQGACNPQNLASHLRPLLHNSTAWHQQHKDLSSLRPLLSAPQGFGHHVTQVLESLMP